MSPVEVGEAGSAPDGGKIFVVSLHRVVTRSTDMLLSMLGYRTVHFPKFHKGKNLHDAVRGLHMEPERVVDVLTPVIEEADALSDVPFPTLYRQLDRRWPGSRFILVHRDPQGWLASVRGMLKDDILSPFDRIQYAAYLGSECTRIGPVSDAQLLEMYFEHLDRVHRYFHEEIGEPERLCTVCVRDPEPGETICRFLGHEPMPLPRISGKDPQGELEVARRWVRMCPTDAGAHYLMGKNMYAMGRLDEAVQELEHALTLDPLTVKAHLYLHRIYEVKGEKWLSWKHATSAVEMGMNKKSNLYLKSSLYALFSGEVRKGGRYFCRGMAGVVFGKKK